MEKAIQRWLKQPYTDIDSFLKTKQWQFRFYNSNIYVLNHVTYQSKYSVH